MSTNESICIWHIQSNLWFPIGVILAYIYLFAGFLSQNRVIKFNRANLMFRVIRSHRLLSHWSCISPFYGHIFPHNVQNQGEVPTVLILNNFPWVTSQGLLLSSKPPNLLLVFLSWSSLTFFLGSLPYTNSVFLCQCPVKKLY